MYRIEIIEIEKEISIYRIDKFFEAMTALLMVRSQIVGTF